MCKTARRDLVLSATDARLLFGVDRPVAFVDVARAQAAQNEVSSYFRYKIGDIDVYSLDDGTIERAIDANFVLNAPVEEVRQALELNGITPDRYMNPLTVTAARIGGEIVLFDTGFGGTGPATAGKLLANMRAAGLDPTTVSTIVISHFHPDHVGGLWTRDANAQVFPQAEILVPEIEYRFWTDVGVTGQVPDFLGGMGQRIQATFPNWGNMRPYLAGEELVSGVRAIATYGHSPGHMSFLLASGQQQLFLQVDVTGFDRLFVRHPSWHSRLDMDGLQAEVTRRRFFDRVLAEGGLLAGYHFRFPSVGTLARDGSGYAFVPLSG